MRTSAVIEVEGVEFAMIYKHWDGQPEATLALLETFNRKFTKDRGNDGEYKIAQLLRETIRSGKRFGYDMSETTGWGIVPFEKDSWADYRYVLNGDGSVSVH